MKKLTKVEKRKKINGSNLVLDKNAIFSKKLYFILWPKASYFMSFTYFPWLMDFSLTGQHLFSDHNNVHVHHLMSRENVFFKNETQLLPTLSKNGEVVRLVICESFVPSAKKRKTSVLFE